MHKSIRQSMAWLHSWTGLLLGWVIFAIFLMGTASYYRHEVNLWMQPQLAQYEIQQHTAIQSATTYLQDHAADAKSWFIGIATPESPLNTIYWQKVDGGYESKTLDANSGKELNLSATDGGDFFYRFHYQLFGLPINIGRLAVCFAAFIMLIALISGIITHKKIFTDFFTLRTFKSQRSWLDFHNVSSVIALPFFLMITFTGLAIFFYLYFPWGMKTLYPNDPYQYFTEIRTQVVAQNTTPEPEPNLSMSTLLQTVEQHWGRQELASITVQNPNTDQALYSFMQLQDHTITRNQPQITLRGTDASLIRSTRNDSAIATLNFGVYGLHMATFAQPVLRLAFFFSGLLGCCMIASGLLLWSLKRQLQNKTGQFHFGHYLVDRFNIATFVGLPMAMLAYLFTNRIVTITSDTPNYEIYAFFTTWSLSLVLALCTPKQWLWRSQLAGLSLVATSLVIFDFVYLLQHHYIHDFYSYWLFLRIDLFILLLAIFAYFIFKNIHPIQLKAAQKLSKKVSTTHEVNAS
ncbi:PepSY-associated TM helix domain-containing protein [Acinetobacter zhairhuonensis]|uniref:PepSY-associated TM helix domain-containing protein n=1 Tax=Acinetobacter sp. A7.4 TaxID=2919921 RepID=UPI001F4E30E8|nr:PepSY-associated TM helix domain-containing protein [Acinetobacter sp. A7.4]MCJ8160713.1 PepSY domain-containing protein [Acinetobacter sp. A7.4]